MNPETRAEAAAWLAKAHTDLRAARKKPLQKTHDLESLGQRVPDIAPSLRDVVSGAHSLSIYASEFRYPGESPEPDLTTAEAGIEIASRAVAAITSWRGTAESRRGAPK